MPFTPVLLILIGIILVADIVIVGAAAARRDQGRRRSAVDGLIGSMRLVAGSAVARMRTAGSSSPSSGSSGRAEADARRDDARTAAAIEAFVADIDRSPGGGIHRRIPAVNEFPREIGGQSTTADHPAPDRPRLTTAAWSESRGPERDSAARPGEPADCASTVTWESLLMDESARVQRFGRPATVVLAECPGLDGVADRLGAVAADRIAAEIDRVLRAESRATDRVVQLGPARFGVLMVETAATDGRRYVERVRDAAGQWFASAGLSPNLAIGWASPDEGEDLVSAAATALGRARTANVESAAPVPR